MRNVTCITGTTQIAKMLHDATIQARQSKLAALLYVGDSMEEIPEELYAHAAVLGSLKVPVYIFQEGNPEGGDRYLAEAYRLAHRTFAEIARLTGGYHAAFEAGNFKDMEK